MAQYLHLYGSESAFNAEYNGEDYREPWVSYTNDNASTEHVNYNKPEWEKLRGTPLTFEVTSDGDIKWSRSSKYGSSARTLYYTINGGPESSITSNSTTLSASFPVVAGDVVRFYATYPSYADRNSPGDHFSFSGTTCGFNLKGNILSLINRYNFRTMDSVVITGYTVGRTFAYLFEYCTGLTNADKLIIPIKTLGTGTLSDLFIGCTSLRTPPDLTFIETMGDYGFLGMFSRCSNLQRAPELPCMTLASQCYQDMFYNCTSLTEAPELPANTLALNCYGSMFCGCTGLTKAPDLLAPVLASYSYSYMFRDCTNINYIKCLATDISADSCVSDWTSGVAATGTFVKKAGVTWRSGIHGIPNGWTVIEV